MHAVAGEPDPLPFARILITGADGFVGRCLVPMLRSRVAANTRIVSALRCPPADHGGDVVPFDLADPRTIDAAIAQVRPDLVIHLAAQASVGEAQGTAAETWAVNLVGSLTMAQAIAAIVPACTVLQVSSAEVYGLTFRYEVATEASPLRPRSAYARSKAAAEAMFGDVLPDDARLIIARPGNHTGAGQDERFVVPAFAAQIARIEQGLADVVHVGNVDAERDFLDVRDVAAAYIALLAAAPALPPRSVFNIASGQPMRIGAILARLQAMSTVDTQIVHDPDRMRPSEVSLAAIDNRAIGDTTGWSPRYDIDATLGAVLASQRARNGVPG